MATASPIPIAELVNEGLSYASSTFQCSGIFAPPPLVMFAKPFDLRKAAALLARPPSCQINTIGKPLSEGSPVKGISPFSHTKFMQRLIVGQVARSSALRKSTTVGLSLKTSFSSSGDATAFLSTVVDGPQLLQLAFGAICLAPLT